MHNVTIVDVAHAPTSRTLEAALRFGLGVRGPKHPHAQLITSLVARVSTPGEVVLLTGPSGAGKSRLLRDIACACSAAERSLHVAELPSFAHSAIDAVAGTVPDALRTLALMGLGDALLALRHPLALSEGERARLALASAVSRASTGVVAQDEFASALDRVSARALCLGVARSARAGLCSFLLATAREDVVPWLRWTSLVRLSPFDTPHVLQRDALVRVRKGGQCVDMQGTSAGSAAQRARAVCTDALSRRHAAGD